MKKKSGFSNLTLNDFQYWKCFKVFRMTSSMILIFFSKSCSFVIVKIIATSKNLLKFESSLLILMNEFIFSPTNIDIGVLKVKEIDFCEEVHNFRVSLIT